MCDGLESSSWNLHLSSLDSWALHEVNFVLTLCVYDMYPSTLNTRHVSSEREERAEERDESGVYVHFAGLSITHVCVVVHCHVMFSTHTACVPPAALKRSARFLGLPIFCYAHFVTSPLSAPVEVYACINLIILLHMVRIKVYFLKCVSGKGFV